jgi:hypothetical protein
VTQGVGTVAAALAAIEDSRFTARGRELEAFDAWLAGETPSLLYIYGVGGAGKSTLLHACARRARARGRTVLALDARDFRPTADAFLAALAAGIGSPDGDCAAIIRALNELRPLLLIDTFEEMADLTRFLQQEFLPSLDQRVRVALAGRHAPGNAWTRAGWDALLQTLPLSQLSRGDALELLRRRGIDREPLAESIVSATGGLPLALALAADVVRQTGAHDLASISNWHFAVRVLVEQLVREVDDPTLHELLDAAALLRQFDQSLLVAVTALPVERVRGAFARLCELSFVRPAQHGLMLHDGVRHILAQDLRWRQHDRYTNLRLRALAYYRERMRAAPAAERGWLLAERFSLWEHGVILATLYSDPVDNDLWLDDCRRDELPLLLELWERFAARHYRFPTDPEQRPAARRLMLASLSDVATRVRVARTRDGEIVGFTSALSLNRRLLAHYPPNGVLVRLLNSYLTPAELARIPDDHADSPYVLFGYLAWEDEYADSARAALLRDLVGQLAAARCFFAAVGEMPQFTALLAALGFQKWDPASSDRWSSVALTHGYVLDVARIGVDRWVEAIMDGRPLPLALSATEVEQELLACLRHWSSDASLLTSRLARLAAFAPLDGSATAVRAAIREALACTLAGATPDAALSLRAVELGYLRPELSQERAAEALAVSRATFYRLLKRGVAELAQVIAAMRPEPDSQPV